MIAITEKIVLTPKEAAAVLNVHVSNMCRLRAAGLKCVFIGKRPRYRIEDLRNWVDSKAEQPTK